MKLVPVESTKTFKAPSWFKLSPDSGFYWYDLYRADLSPKRLCRSTGERENKQIALKIAEKAIARWMGKEATGDVVRVTFADIAKETLANYRAKLQKTKIRPGTMAQAEIYVGYLIEEFGLLYLDQLTEGVWLRFVAQFQRDKPSQVLENHWKYMGIVMNYAHKCGLAPKPWSAENPDPKRKAGRVLSEDEKTALLAVARPNLRDQLVMAMTMGMRLREHLKLSWDRVDFEAKTITLRPEDTKTKKGRVMKMSPQVYTMLVARKAGYYRHRKNSSPWVFPAPGNPSKPMHQNKSAWRTAKDSAGIEGRCRYHDLRHTFLTECAKLVRQGEVSVVLICAYAGLSIKTFERVYLHLNHEDTAAVASMIAVKLRESPTTQAVTTRNESTS
jgi:integrase